MVRCSLGDVLQRSLSFKGGPYRVSCLLGEPNTPLHRKMPCFLSGGIAGFGGVWGALIPKLYFSWWVGFLNPHSSSRRLSHRQLLRILVPCRMGISPPQQGAKNLRSSWLYIAVSPGHGSWFHESVFFDAYGAP